MKVDIYTSLDGFALLRNEWNDLLCRSVTDVIFLTWEWQHTWWTTYACGELLLISVRDDDGRLIGIAPWFIQERDGERIIRTVGCVDVTDYVDVIADREAVHQVLAQLAASLRALADRFDRINLCNIPEASLTYRLFPDQLRLCGFEADMILQEVCPVIHLPSTWDDYLAMLDKKQRHELRRKIRRAENEVRIRYYTLTSDTDFDIAVEKFLTLMAESQPAKAEFLADQQNAQFFRRILRVVHERGWLRLSFLDMNDVPTAAYCCFDYNREIQVYNSGLRPDHCAHLSPGIVLLCYDIQQAIESGHVLFDFLRGNEAYKYRMGAQDTRIYKLIARLATEINHSTTVR